MAVAAPILCAGLAVWRGLKQKGAREGQWIAVPGAGGGLGSLAVQYAVYRGLKVIAIDSGADKKKMLEEMGAAVFMDFNETKDLVESVRAATLSAHVGPLPIPYMECETLIYSTRRRWCLALSPTSAGRPPLSHLYPLSPCLYQAAITVSATHRMQVCLPGWHSLERRRS